MKLCIHYQSVNLAVTQRWAALGPIDLIYLKIIHLVINLFYKLTVIKNSIINLKAISDNK